MINNDKIINSISDDLNNDYSNDVNYDLKINQKYCGSNTCKFLFSYRLPEQETRANFHFQTMTELAEKLNRTMVLTNVGRSRISSCNQFPYNFYYNLDILQEKFPNVKFISQANFQQWAHERHKKPDVFHAYINTDKTNEPNTFGFVEPFVEILLNKHCFNQFQLNMDDNMSFKHVNIGPTGLWKTKHKNSIMSKYLISQLNMSTDVLLINHDLRSNLFLDGKEISPVPYANHLIKAANKVADELDSYIGIHWRMETGVTKPLTQCANKLVEWVNRMKKTANISNVYFATDYPINGMGKAQSSTFHVVKKTHHDAVKILNSSMHLNTWMSTNSLEYLEEIPELSEILKQEFEGPGVQGIMDKLILILSNYFVIGSEGCCRVHSSFTGRVIRSRMAMMKAGNPRIKNIVSHW
ncbi:2572_t:CDS:1 [Cetraspora pellucida]|uniref:2572_t:CDS:1 n=1 Tax=Cetraspora pellucida TaxID=1433469 RepID=A0A9N9CXK4_9GLOM|nr:2572_t:CDS:1 [Cetraspora pellucida]